MKALLAGIHAAEEPTLLRHLAETVGALVKKKRDEKYICKQWGPFALINVLLVLKMHFSC